jgi:hypothetical protein
MSASKILRLLLLVAAWPSWVLAEASGQNFPTVPGKADPAARQISVTVNPGVVRTIDLPSEGLRQARLDLLAGLPVLDADLRALADQRDGLAAQRYVRRLLEATPRGSDSDVAYYGSIAVATGRVWSLPDAIEAMKRLDSATEPPDRVAVYADVLYPHAWAGNSLALEAIIDLNGEGRLFGPLSEATRARILNIGERAGDGRIALSIALIAMQSADLSPTALDQARDCLTRAKAGSDLAVQVMATTLLNRLDGTIGGGGTSQ